MMFAPEDQALFPHEVITRISISMSDRQAVNTWLHAHIPDGGDHGLRDDWLWISNGDPDTYCMVFRFKHEHHAIRFALTWT